MKETHKKHSQTIALLHSWSMQARERAIKPDIDKMELRKNEITYIGHWLSSDNHNQLDLPSTQDS